MSVEVPRSLKHLVQRVMRGFYPIEHAIVVDLLIRRQLIKEDDMIELLKFEKKQLRSVLAMLEKDKLTKKKLRIETGVDGKSTRQHYYYINYKAFVNVVKYKLDHMRKKIELEERDLTARASFVCDECHKTFTDLEVDQLLDIMTGEMRCSFCGGEVKEDPNHLPKADSRLLLAKFNQIMEPLWLLLKDVEDIRLTSDLLEPELQVSTSGLQSQANAMNSGFTGKQWSDKNSRINSDFGNALLGEQNNFTIKIEDSYDQVDGGSADSEMVKPKKEAPAWMLESTVSNINQTVNSISGANDVFTQNSNKTNNRNMSKTNPIQSSNSDSNEPSKEILETLLIHEKQQEHSSSAVSLLLNDTTNHLQSHYNNNDNNEDEIMSDNEDDETIHQPMVTVGNQLVPLNEVNDQIISQMSDEEKEQYIRLTQQFYAHMYDI